MRTWRVGHERSSVCLSGSLATSATELGGRFWVAEVARLPTGPTPNANQRNSGEFRYPCSRGSVMRQAVVVASSRTPLAKSFRGSLNRTRPDDQAAHCIRDLLRKVP